jgi:hypothetical protein
MIWPNAGSYLAPMNNSVPESIFCNSIPSVPGILHHPVELGQQMLVGVDIQNNPLEIGFMHGPDYFHRQGIAQLTCHRHWLHRQTFANPFR